jgi:hypothetical protein
MISNIENQSLVHIIEKVIRGEGRGGEGRERGGGGEIQQHKLSTQHNTTK